jgi:WD40 repeat protein
MSTEEWQRTGFWIAGSMITQLGAYGQHLLSSDYNGEVSVWNPSNGELVRKLTGHTGRVLAFAEVGALLATCSFDKTVRLWSLSQTEQVDQIAFQSLPIGMVAWDGKLAVADSRADTQIFACEEGVWACIWTLKVPGQLTSLALSPCNDLLSVVDRFVYSAHSHKGPLRKLIGYDRLDKCVCAVDDTLAVGYSDKSMPRTALYTNDGRCLGIIFTESVRGMVAIGGRLAVATAGGLVTFVD